MKNRIVCLVFILILFSSSLVNAISIKSIKKSDDIENISDFTFDGDILYVGGDGLDNYTKIQYAIDNSTDGDVIFVYNGTYFEAIKINKTISLIGEDKYKTIIDAREEGNVIYVYNDWVNISDFTIKNSSIVGDHISGIRIYSNHTIIEDNIIMDNTFGIEHFAGLNTNIRLHNNSIENNIFNNNALSIYIRNSDNNGCNNNLINNNINGMFGGIALAGSTHNIINNNEITGLIYPSGYGIGLHDSISNEISYNEIKNCTMDGIYLEVSKLNNIHHNNITNVDNYGISITDSRNNKIHYNTISDIGKKGIYIINGFKNIIHHNKIIKSQDGICISDKSRRNNIFYNEIKDITNKGLYIEKSSFNKIHHNNFINCKIKSFIWLSYFNLFHRNYWNRPRILPKRIFGIGNILIGRQDLFPKFFPNQI